MAASANGCFFCLQPSESVLCAKTVPHTVNRQQTLQACIFLPEANVFLLWRFKRKRLNRSRPYRVHRSVRRPSTSSRNSCTPANTAATSGESPHSSARA